MSDSPADSRRGAGRDSGLDSGRRARRDSGSPDSGRAGDVAVVLGTFLLVGVACGVVWWLLVEPATFTKVASGGSMGEDELAKRFNADGWYAVIAAVAGLTVGLLLTLWRSRDFVLTTVLLVVGSGIAAAAMALSGHLLGPGDPNAALAAAAPGTAVPVQLGVDAKACYLIWPMAALVGALMVLWSPPKDAER
jgi:hypothetical protein